MSPHTDAGALLKLAGCPFCGLNYQRLSSDPRCFAGQVYPGETGDEGWKIRCDSCGCQTCWWHTEEQVRSAWNTRQAASQGSAGGEPKRITGCVSVVEEAACLIWDELCPGMVMGDADLPHYEAAAKAVLALSPPVKTASPQDVQEACAQVADRTALRCVREQIPGDATATFIAKAIRALIPPVKTGGEAEIETGPVTEQEYLADNIATVAWHLGRPGAQMRVENDMCGLAVDAGEVLKEVSRRLTTPAQEASNCGKVREVLGAFYKTVDVMKSARNKPDHLMSVWADDMKAIEDVMFFLENLRDSGAPRPRGEPTKTDAAQPVGSPNIRAAVIEECAKAVEAYGGAADGSRNDKRRMRIAAAVRALSLPSASRGTGA